VLESNLTPPYNFKLSFVKAHPSGLLVSWFENRSDRGREVFSRSFSPIPEFPWLLYFGFPTDPCTRSLSNDW